MSNITNYLGLRPVLTAALSPYGVIGDIKFVCNAPHCTTGFGQYDAPYSKLEHALADGGLKASAGDAVVVLPGHVEDVVDERMLDDWQAGVAIIGVGFGVLTPRFRWTTTASQWRVNVAGAVLVNLNLELGTVPGVVKAIDIKSPSCIFTQCLFAMTNTAASGFVVTGIEVGDGAFDCAFLTNRFFGDPALPSTDGILLSGATTPPSRFRFQVNQMQFAAGASTGLIRINTAARGCLITANLMANTAPSSTATVFMEDVVSQGSFNSNQSIVTDQAGNASGKGLQWAGNNPIWSCAGDVCSDTNQANAVTSPAAST